MNNDTYSISEDDDSLSFPSMPTVRASSDCGVSEAIGRIDHYDLIKKLGGGGFGIVYLARDTNSGVDVAFKTLHPMLKTNAEEMENVRANFKLVSGLYHPNIAVALTLHKVGSVSIAEDGIRRELKLSPGDPVMVMAYAPGIPLSRWRKQYPNGIVPFPQTIEIARQIAAALDYAHGAHVVHRDVKPANIMVESLGGGRVQVRILDFGLAAEIRSSMGRLSQELGDTSGTRPYMAPEQWTGRKQDGRTDQYAFACVLYELLSGEPPLAGVFDTGDPLVMMAAVENRMPEPIPGLDEKRNAALLKALSKNPSDRYDSCTDLVKAILEGEPGEPVLPDPSAFSISAEIGGTQIDGSNRQNLSSTKIRTRLSMTVAIVFQGINLVFFMVMTLVFAWALLFENHFYPNLFYGFWYMHMFWGSIIFLISLSVSARMHYKCWEAIPKGFGRMTPRDSINSIFIPFLNVFGVFRSVGGLGADCAAIAEIRGLRGFSHLPKLGTALSVLLLPVVLIIPLAVVFFPVVSLVYAIVFYVCWHQFYAAVIRLLSLVSQPVSVVPESVIETGKMDVTCPHCSAQLETEGSLLGQYVNCPVCGRQFRLWPKRTNGTV